jgi:phosphoribosylanthranilate isomerase
VLRTRVKICGLTSVEEAVLAASLGADAIGLVFYPRSKRALSVDAAVPIREALPAFVSAVGLFVNPTEAEIETVLKHLHLDCLQFHGDESPQFCASFGLPYMKAIRVRDGLDLEREIAKYTTSSAILLDSYDPHFAGGTGTRFNWEIAAGAVQAGEQRIVLAGGLDAQNVAAAIQQVQPYAVDVSSGVESAPGRKCPERMQAFFSEVKSV